MILAAETVAHVAATGAIGPGRQVAYDVIVGLHVVSALVGFGSVALVGVYGSTAAHPDRPGAVDELRRFFSAPARADLAIVAVPFFGLAALGVGPGSGRVAQAWVAVGAALWLVAVALLFRIVRPAEALLRDGFGQRPGSHRRPALVPPDDQPAAAGRGASPDGPGGEAGPPDLGKLGAAGRRLARASAACDVIFVAALVVMVIQPGS